VLIILIEGWDRDQRSYLLKQIIIILVFAACLVAGAEAPQRTVDNNLIISERDPKVRIELPKSVRYVGADRWVLLGIADCELHAFVEGDKQQKVQRFYWVQFEGYLPTKPELKHQYDSPRHATLGGLDFYVDTWTRANGEKITPGSDLEHIRSLIHAKGYKLPAEMMSVRLVHLMDDKRKELMIIYAEDLSPTGFTAADLKKGGKAYDQWPIIEKSLVERAKNKITIQAAAP
jgi:hypothetical protein